MSLHQQEARLLPRHTNQPTRKPSKDPGIYRCRECTYVGETRSQALPDECPRCKSELVEWLLR